MLTFPKNFEHAVDFLCVDEENPWQHTDSIGYYATLRSCHMSLVPTGKVLNLARHRPGLVVVDVTCMERKSLHASGVTSVNCSTQSHCARRYLHIPTSFPVLQISAILARNDLRPRFPLCTRVVSPSNP